MSGPLPIRRSHAKRLLAAWTPWALLVPLLYPMPSAAATCDDHPRMTGAIDAVTASWAAGRGFALTPGVEEQVRVEFCEAAAEVATRMPGSAEQIPLRIPQVVGRYLEQQVGAGPYTSLLAELYNELGALGPSRPMSRQFIPLKIDYRGTSPDRIRLDGRLLPVRLSLLATPGPVELDGLHGDRVVCHAHRDVERSLAGPSTIECAAAR